MRALQERHDSKRGWLMIIAVGCLLSAGAGSVEGQPLIPTNGVVAALSEPSDSDSMTPTLTRGMYKRRDGGSFWERFWSWKKDDDQTTEQPASPPTSPAPTSPTPTSPTPVSTPSVTSMSFTGMEGGANPANQTITLTNTGGGTLNWSVSDNASWLSLNPTSGATTTNPSVITVSVNTSGLTSNTYNGMITVSTQGATVTSQQISVTLTLTAPSPTIAQSPTALSFVGVQGGSNPTSQTLNISNSGKGTLSWTASETSPWLSISPASGTATTGTSKVTVSVNTAGLASNSYTTNITISDPTASNNSQTVPVTLVVTAPVSGSAELSWLPNTESDLAGYKIYMGTSSKSYGSPIDVGNSTTHKIIGLPTGKTYYFAVTAYNKNGGESGYSNEVSKSLP